jgi:hypothetical protein
MTPPKKSLEITLSTTELPRIYLRSSRRAIERSGGDHRTVNQVNTGFHGGNTLDTLHQLPTRGDPSAVPKHGEL